MEIRFKAKIREVGGTSLGITIPKIFLDNNYLEEGKEYMFKIEEDDNGEQQRS